MTEIQLEFRLCFDSDLSGLLCLSVNFIFVLLWPAAFTVSHDSSQCESKEWAIPYHTTEKVFYILLTMMAYKTCNGIDHISRFRWYISWNQSLNVCWGYSSHCFSPSQQLVQMHLLPINLSDKNINLLLKEEMQTFQQTSEGKTKLI